MRFPFLVFLACAITLARGAPLERDLGGGLIYYRTKSVPADIPTAPPAPKRSAVLDLRYAAADGNGVTALETWLKTHAGARTPVFVLANAATSPALLAMLSRHNPKDGVILLGAASPGFAPDIAISFPPEAERRAYEAFESNSDTNALLKENPAKVRNDEARLSREHLSTSTGEETAAPPDEKPSPTTAPPAPIDFILQRALHLHRALLALKKL
ncbi:MAG: hypothetical protein ABIZ81_10865 [Opitutaceae bacterium]